MSSKLNLCLHTGGQAATWDQVKAAATPASTKSWHPIPHVAFVKTVQDCLVAAGLEVAQQVHALAIEGKRYFGMMEVLDPQAKANGDDYGLVIGARNSHDKRFPAALVFGDQVFVCDNLCFNGEIKIGRKHTRHIMRDLPRLVAQAVGKLGAARHAQDTRIAHYKEQEFTDAQVHDLLVRSLDAKIISSSKIGKVLTQWREPNHPEFKEAKTAWRLHNAYTEVLKGFNPFALPAIHERLNGLLDTETGLVLEKEKIVDVEVVAA